MGRILRTLYLRLDQFDPPGDLLITSKDGRFGTVKVLRDLPQFSLHIVVVDHHAIDT